MYRTYTLVVETDDPDFNAAELDELITDEVGRLTDELSWRGIGDSNHKLALNLSIGELRASHGFDPELAGKEGLA